MVLASALVANLLNTIKSSTTSPKCLLSFVVLRCLVAVRERLAKRHLVLGVKDIGCELGVLHL